MNKPNIPRTRRVITRHITELSLPGEPSCSYCRTGCGDGTIRYRGIAICPDCFLRIARLFFEKDFDLVINSGGKTIALD